MTALEKFMFDRSFDPAEEPEGAEQEDEEEQEPEEEIPTFSEDDLKKAREAAFAEGKQEGVQEAAATMERFIHDAMQTLSSQFSEISLEQQRTNAQTFEDCVHIAVGIVRKCFPSLKQEQGLTEIEQMTGKVLHQILEEPRVIIHIHPDLQVQFSEKIDQIVDEASFEGRVIVTEDKTIEHGGCRIEWSNGAAERDMDVLWREIDEVVRHNLSDVQDLVDQEDETPAETRPGDGGEDVAPADSGEGVAAEDSAGLAESEGDSAAAGDAPVVPDTASELTGETPTEADSEPAVESAGTLDETGPWPDDDHSDGSQHVEKEEIISSDVDLDSVASEPPTPIGDVDDPPQTDDTATADALHEDVPPTADMEPAIDGGILAAEGEEADPENADKPPVPSEMVLPDDADVDGEDDTDVNPEEV